MLRNGLEPWHLLIVAIVLIVLFGSKKLPDTARSLGRSMRILKSEAKALKDENATTDVEGGVTSGAGGGAVADAATGATSGATHGEPPAAAR
ncbi:Sec-independent protein translocase subunit TatA [Streptomyces sp. NPDC050287]|uniref:Sec-independent protein translocase subunit TatA n=1 Tax=Streptomyces sp. NPDC050287 TaxID=3365608 RepID=UPI00379DF3C1